MERGTAKTLSLGERVRAKRAGEGNRFKRILDRRFPSPGSLALATLSPKERVGD
jgi:hypothetical protein